MSTTKMAAFIREMMRKVHMEETEDMKKILEADSFQVEVPNFIIEPIQAKTFDFHGAVNDTGIRSTVTARTLERIEEEQAKKLQAIFGLSPEKYKELRGNPKERTFTEFLDVLYPELKTAFGTPATQPENDGKHKEVIEGLQTNLAAISQEFENFKIQAAQQQKDILTGYKLEMMLNDYQFRDELKDAAPGLRKMILDDLKNAFIAKEDETGNLIPYLRNEPEVRATNPTNNALRNYKEIIEEKMTPYIKRSQSPGEAPQVKQITVDPKEVVKKLHTAGSAPGLGIDI